MTETLTSLRKQIETTHDLQSVVTTMKALSSVNIRRYQEAVDALITYRQTIEMGFQVIFRNQPHVRFATVPQQERAIVIVFGTDQGLVGQFNNRVVEYMHGDLEQPADDRVHILCAVGLRLLPHLDDLNYDVESVRRVPGAIDGITPTVRDLLLQVAEWRQAHSIDRLVLFYNRPTSRAAYTTERLDLLPLDPNWLQTLRQRGWESNSIPTARVDWSVLFSQLTQQYLFASMYAALANSLASENASRLASMENAEKNIDKRLDSLRQNYNLKRQDSITEELFDVIAGFEVLRDK